MCIHCKIKEYKGFHYWKDMPSQEYSVAAGQVSVCVSPKSEV